MSSLNKVSLIGNVGKVEIRNTQSGDPIANVSLATSERWKDRSSGEQRERTEWHRVSIFGGLAGVVEQYVKVGDKLYVEGQLRTRKWTDKDGQDRYTTEVNVSGFGGTMIMLGSPGARSNAPKPSEGKSLAELDDEIPF